MSANSASSHSLPLADEQAARLGHALDGLTRDQLQWVSGFAAGLAAAEVSPAPAMPQAVTPTDTTPLLTILYGSQTGNGEGVAERLADAAGALGLSVDLHNLADYKPANLKREAFVAIIVSTHGEGDPPDDAELFHEYLTSATAPRFETLRYGVLALGDSSYANFCQTGRELDQRLEELGARRVLPIVECDLDYTSDANGWCDTLIDMLPHAARQSNVLPALRAVETGPRYGREHPYPAEVLVNQKITGSDSSKDIRHIELSIDAAAMPYEPGDALAVVVSNPPQLVGEFLAALGVDADSEVVVDGGRFGIASALASRLEITLLHRGFVETWARLSGSELLERTLADTAALESLFATHQVIDLVHLYPARADAQAFVDALRPLSPRSYSIASSPAANVDEVHLTVAALQYEAFGREHWGAASTHLAHRVAAGDRVDVFVEPNARFRLPENDATDIIMIGPGTGVAPFRAFVEERIERGATGRNWLFFGDRNFSSDFLYQLEWQRYLKKGALARLDVAFSRDQAEKIYVQDRIRERGAEFVRWLNAGAHVYVCGDAKRMAPDVDRALTDTLVTHAGLDHDAAVARLKELRRAGRYQRDVY